MKQYKKWLIPTKQETSLLNQELQDDHCSFLRAEKLYTDRNDSGKIT